MTKIICAGLIAADLVFELENFPLKGTKNRAKASHMITGGGALNAASAIAGMGGKVFLAGTIGDDDFGIYLRAKMADRKIDDQFVETIAGATTSRSANMITSDGDRTIINHRDAALVAGALELPSDFPFDGHLWIRDGHKRQRRSFKRRGVRENRQSSMRKHQWRTHKPH